MRFKGVSACTCDPGHCAGANKLPFDEYCLHEEDDQGAVNTPPEVIDQMEKESWEESREEDTRKWPDDFRGFGIIVKF